MRQIDLVGVDRRLTSEKIFDGDTSISVSGRETVVVGGDAS